MLEIGDGETDLDSLKSRESHDLASGGLRNLDAIEALVGEELRHARLLGFLRCIKRQQRHRISDVNGPPLDAADPQTSEVR